MKEVATGHVDKGVLVAGQTGSEGGISATENDGVEELPIQQAQSGKVQVVAVSRRTDITGMNEGGKSIDDRGNVLKGKMITTEAACRKDVMME